MTAAATLDIPWLRVRNTTSQFLFSIIKRGCTTKEKEVRMLMGSFIDSFLIGALKGFGIAIVVMFIAWVLFGEYDIPKLAREWRNSWKKQ